MAWDDRLPRWQQQLNQTCENWIFAFLVAFAIRHFALEAFQIPTASMEPMLYGDAAFLKRDFVVVDKVTPRFTGYRRYDPTVFQFPLAEVEAGKGEARPAEDARGRRLDVPMWRPLFNRNFVKRLLVLPGDTFYISGGDVVIRQADGTWDIPAKPDATQEALWDAVWSAGGQPGYAAWTQGGKPVEDPRGLDLSAGAVAFTQPLRNVYLKPANAAVRPAFSQDPQVLVPLSQLAPQFQWQGRNGSLYDLDAWEINRITTRDQDNGLRGTALNQVSTEWNGDVRVRFSGLSTTGDPEVSGAYRVGDAAPVLAWSLRLSSGVLTITDHGATTTHQVPGLPAGEVSVGRCDRRIIVRVGGQPALAVPVAIVDANRQRLALGLGGTGSFQAASMVVERDLHYSAQGVMQPFADAGQEDAIVEAAFAKPSSDDGFARDDMLMKRLGLWDTRAQFLGKDKLDLTVAQRRNPVAISPETAVTAPAGCYLLLGDNSPHSWDGRSWGWVPEENLRGRPLAVAFPPWRMHVVR